MIVPEEAEAEAAAQVLEAQQNGQNTPLPNADEPREEAQGEEQTNEAPEQMEDIVQAQDAEHESLPSTADAATSTTSTTTAAGATKRRQSASSESEFKKRTRLSPSSAFSNPTPGPNPTPATSTTAAARRKAPADLARNRRLFGGLLSTLSASSAPSTATHQRRLDIESRAAAKLALSSAAAESARSERAAELWATRQREQERWTEYEMRVRHERVRAVAGSLETRTRPVLYWRPYELRGEERERIERQRLDAEEMVQRELEDFERQRDQQQQRRRRRRRSSPYSNGARQRRASSSDYGDENRPRTRLEAVNGHGNENGHGHGEKGDSGRDGMEAPTRRKSGDAGGGADGMLGAGDDAPEPVREAEGGQSQAMQVEAGTEETPAREPGEDNEEMMVDAGEDAVIY